MEVRQLVQIILVVPNPMYYSFSTRSIVIMRHSAVSSFRIDGSEGFLRYQRGLYANGVIRTP